MYTMYGDGPDPAVYSAVLHDLVLNRTDQGWSNKTFWEKNKNNNNNALNWYLRMKVFNICIPKNIALTFLQK